MFGLGITEIIFIVLLAALILGPEHMPKAAQQLGKWSAKLRSTATSLTQSLAQDEDIQTLTADLKDIRRDLSQSRKEFHSLKSELVAPVRISTDAIQEAIQAAERSAEAASSSEEHALPATAVSSNEALASDSIQQPSPFLNVRLGDMFCPQSSPTPHESMRSVSLLPPKLLPGPLSRQVSRKRVQLLAPSDSQPHRALGLHAPIPGRAFYLRRKLPGVAKPNGASMHACPLPPLVAALSSACHSVAISPII